MSLESKEKEKRDRFKSNLYYTSLELLLRDVYQKVAPEKLQEGIIQKAMTTYRGYEDIMASRLYLKYKTRECAKLLAFVKELHFEGQIERRSSKKWAYKARKKYGFEQDKGASKQILDGIKDRRGSVLRHTPSQAHMKLESSESFAELRPSAPMPLFRSRDKMPPPSHPPPGTPALPLSPDTTYFQHFTSDDHPMYVTPGLRSQVYPKLNRVNSTIAATPSNNTVQRRSSLIDHVKPRRASIVSVPSLPHKIHIKSEPQERIEFSISSEMNFAYDHEDGRISPIPDQQRPRNASHILDLPSFPHERTCPQERLSSPTSWDDFDDNGIISPISDQRPREVSHIDDLPSLPHVKNEEFELPYQYTAPSTKRKVRDLYTDPLVAISTTLNPLSSSSEKEEEGEEEPKQSSSTAADIASEYDKLSQRVEDQVEIETESTLQREQESMQLVDMLQHAYERSGSSSSSSSSFDDNEKRKTLDPSHVIQIANTFFETLLKTGKERLNNINENIEKYREGITKVHETDTIRVVQLQERMKVKYAEVASIFSVLSNDTGKRNQEDVNMSISILKDHSRRLDTLIDKSREERARDAKFVYESKDKIFEQIRRSLRDNARLEKRSKELELKFMKEVKDDRIRELNAFQQATSSTTTTEQSSGRYWRLKLRNTRERVRSLEYKLSTRCTNLKTLSTKINELKRKVKSEKASTLRQLYTIRRNVFEQSVRLHRNVKHAIANGDSTRLKIRALVLKDLTMLRRTFRRRRAGVLRNLERERIRVMRIVRSNLRGGVDEVTSEEENRRSADLRRALNARKKSYIKTQNESEALKLALEKELGRLDKSLS